MTGMIRVATSAMTGALVATLISATADAAGFEKAITWGGRSAGVAGIATPYVQGAEALYFNPAGLAGDKVGHSIAFNLSPTSSQFKGPINNNNDVVTSESKLLLPFSLIYGWTVDEQFGFGVGAFVSGGANASFPDLEFGTASGYKPEVKTDLSLVEVSAGVGYKVSDDLKLGLAWRAVMANADFSFVQRTLLGAGHNGVTNAKLTGLKDTQYLAFRAGAQYKLSEATELGLTFRSEVNFQAKGTAGGQVSSFLTANGAANPALTSNEATAHTTFPMAISLGFKTKMDETWSLFGEYGFAQYSRIGEIVVDSATFNAQGGKARLKTDWRDQHSARLAAEYMTSSWPIRFGYGFTSTVTNSDYARASFTPPGPAHTLTLGTGQEFAMGENALRFDAAFEYSMTSGDASNGAAAGVATAGNDTRAGTYLVNAYVAHLGINYSF